MIERAVFFCFLCPRLETRSPSIAKVTSTTGIRVFIDDGHYLPAKHGTFHGYGGGRCSRSGKINPIGQCVFSRQLDNPDAYARAFCLCRRATRKEKEEQRKKRNKKRRETEKRNEVRTDSVAPVRFRTRRRIFYELIASKSVCTPLCSISFFLFLFVFFFFLHLFHESTFISWLCTCNEEKARYAWNEEKKGNGGGKNRGTVFAGTKRTKRCTNYKG